MTMKTLYIYIKALSLVGVGLAVYLLGSQIFQPSFQPCRINGTVNCDAIISGEVSKTFGLPTPLIGLVGYLVIFVSAVLKKQKLMVSMAVFGLVFCLWIAYREFFELRVICPVCILCQVTMLGVFLFSLLTLKNSRG